MATRNPKKLSLFEEIFVELNALINHKYSPWTLIVGLWKGLDPVWIFIQILEKLWYLWATPAAMWFAYTRLLINLNANQPDWIINPKWWFVFTFNLPQPSGGPTDVSTLIGLSIIALIAITAGYRFSSDNDTLKQYIGRASFAAGHFLMLNVLFSNWVL